MKIWMRRTTVGLLVVALAPGALLVYALYRAHQRMDRPIDIPAYALEVPVGAFVDDGSMRVKGANISPGPGSRGARGRQPAS